MDLVYQPTGLAFYKQTLRQGFCQKHNIKGLAKSAFVKQLSIDLPIFQPELTFLQGF